MKKFVKLSVLFFCLLATASVTMFANAQTTDKDKREKVFYRYIDEKGVRVVSLTIPPEAVARGYDLVSFSGEVLKNVPPAAADPTREAQEKKAAKDRAKADTELRRNYSTPQDIEAAKVRKLQQLNDTIEILQGSLVSTRSQLKLHESNAANIERAGKTVPDDLAKNIASLRTQEKDIQIQIKARQDELKNVADKFDQDKTRFILITNQNASAAASSAQNQ